MLSQFANLGYLVAAGRHTLLLPASTP